MDGELIYLAAVLAGRPSYSNIPYGDPLDE